MALHPHFSRSPYAVLELARHGAIAGLAGVDGPYEPPEDPLFTVRTGDEPGGQAAARHVVGQA